MFSQMMSGWIAVEPDLCQNGTVDNRGESLRIYLRWRPASRPPDWEVMGNGRRAS